MKALGETVKLQQQLFQILSKGGAVPAAGGAAAPEEPPAGAASAESHQQDEVEVPIHANGECEAVTRLDERDLSGCLTCIRASGHQVVMGGGMSVSIVQHAMLFQNILVMGGGG